MKKVAIELGVEHFDASDAHSIEEMLHASIRRMFNAGSRTGCCLGGKYTPYITVFVPSNMGFEHRKYVLESELEYYKADLSAGRGGWTYVHTEVINDTRAKMAHCSAKDYVKIIRFCPGAYDLQYIHGVYRASKAGNPCFSVSQKGKQTLVRVSWANGWEKKNGEKPELRWNLTNGNPPPGVPKYRQHNWDFERIDGYHAPEILVPVPDGYLKFAALTFSNNHGAGVMWFIVDRIRE